MKGDYRFFLRATIATTMNMNWFCCRQAGVKRESLENVQVVQSWRWTLLP